MSYIKKVSGSDDEIRMVLMDMIDTMRESGYPVGVILFDKETGSVVQGIKIVQLEQGEKEG